MLDHFGKGLKLIRSCMKKKAKKKKKKTDCCMRILWQIFCVHFFYTKDSKACKMHQLYGWQVRVKSTTFQKSDLKVDFLQKSIPTSYNTDKKLTKTFK